jgi:hypothetical protein
MDNKVRQDASMKLAQLNMICGLGMSLAVVLAMVSVITYLVGVNGLWLPVVIIVVAALFWLGRKVTKQSIGNLEG